MESVYNTTESSERQTPKNATKTSSVLNELSKEMLKSTGDYVKMEIDICIADYITLEKMNTVLNDKYNNLADVSSSINVEMTKLNETYTNLIPMLAQIDDLENCVNQLEQSANKLEIYSKRLETKYKQFQEKNSSK